MEVLDGEVVGGKITLRQLNEKAVSKLHELLGQKAGLEE